MGKFSEGIAEEVHEFANRGLGTEFWLKTTVVSSNILTAARSLTIAASLGELVIEDIILKTDGTGIAGAGTLKITCTNSKGTDVIMQALVARLGANRTFDLESARQFTQQEQAPGLSMKTVLEQNKAIQIHASESNLTGAGTVDVYIKCRRLAAGADLKTA